MHVVFSHYKIPPSTNLPYGCHFFNILVQYHTLLLRIHFLCEITKCWTKIKSYLKRTKFCCICVFPACTSICNIVFLVCSRMYDCGPASANVQSCARPYLPEKDTEWSDSWFLRVSSSCCLSWRLWWFSDLLFHRQLCSVTGSKPSCDSYPVQTYLFSTKT